MNKKKSTPLLAATLAMFLSGCALAPDGRSPVFPAGTNPLALVYPSRDSKETEARAKVARACPTPTPVKSLPAIERELVAAIAAGAAPDTLATEWERLDEGARKCAGRL